MAERMLVIGNKSDSSLLLRGWLGLCMLQLPLRDQRIAVDQPQTHADILRYSPAGLVPGLTEDGVPVYETLALLEYLNEVHARGKLLPKEEYERRLVEWVPSPEDKAFVKSLMQKVVEPGKMAAWIAPPDRGINNLPIDYEYVHLS